MKPAAALCDGDDVGDNWTTCANHVYPTAVKLQPPAYQHSVFYLPDAFPAPKPTTSKLVLSLFFLTSLFIQRSSLQIRLDSANENLWGLLQLS